MKTLLIKQEPMEDMNVTDKQMPEKTHNFHHINEKNYSNLEYFNFVPNMYFNIIHLQRKQQNIFE